MAGANVCAYSCLCKVMCQAFSAVVRAEKPPEAAWKESQAGTLPMPSAGALRRVVLWRHVGCHPSRWDICKSSVHIRHIAGQLATVLRDDNTRSRITW